MSFTFTLESLAPKSYRGERQVMLCVDRNPETQGIRNVLGLLELLADLPNFCSKGRCYFIIHFREQTCPLSQKETMTSVFQSSLQ